MLPARAKALQSFARAATKKGSKPFEMLTEYPSYALNIH